MSLRSLVAGAPTYTLAAALTLVTPGLANANSAPYFEDNQPIDTVDFVVGLGITTGGDKLAKVGLVDDDGDTSSQDIYAGAFIHIYGGIDVLIPDSDFSVQATIGWFADTITADDGSVSFTRYPIEVIPYYYINNIRLGFGLTYHLNPTFDGSDADIGDADFDDALGTVLSAEYLFNKRFALGVRFTSIEYELSDSNVSSNNIDGSNVGIYGSFLF